jgi:excisionase family DNA binding protein
MRAVAEFLTTGQAATMLGASRQHVVDLCNRGELASISIGSHRRIRRRDVLAFASRAARMSPPRREALLSLWLGRAVAGKIALDPAAALEHGRRNLREIERDHPEAGPSVREWERLIEDGPEAVMAALTSPTQAAADLRQNSPFFGLIPQHERDRVVDAFHAHWRATRATP